MSTMSASTVVAASIAPYVSDNFTARASTSAFKIPDEHLAQFSAWKTATSDRQWYWMNDGNTLTLGSVGANETRPVDAIPVKESELHLVYASLNPDLQQSVVDWGISRAQDELLRNVSYASANSYLNIAPEVDVNADLSSMTQDELVALLKQLVRISQDLNASSAQGNAQDLQAKALQLGLSVDLLTQALELQSTFEAQTKDGDIKSNGNSGNGTDSTAGTGNGNSTESAPKTDTELNAKFEAAINELVARYEARVDAALLAYQETAASSLPQELLNSVTRTSFAALLKSLKSSADLGYLATSAELQFGFSGETMQTADGFLLSTAAVQSRKAQIAAVTTELEKALGDPALKSNFTDALLANADNLGTADIALPVQTQFYGELTDALLKTIAADPELLADIAAEAVDSGNRFFEMLRNELESAANVSSAELAQFS